MGIVRYVKGNMQQVLQKADLLAFSVEDMKKAVQTPVTDPMFALLSDLNLGAFLPTAGKNTDDFLNSWLNANTGAYQPGDMYANQTGKFLERFAGSTQQDCFSTIQKIQFAYYDDKGVLCAFSLFVDLSPTAVSTWAATIVRNTTAPSSEQETFFAFAHEHSDKSSLERMENPSDLLNFLGSEELKNKLKSLFSPDGTLDKSRFFSPKRCHLNAAQLRKMESKTAEFEAMARHFELDKKLADVRSTFVKKMTPFWDVYQQRVEHLASLKETKTTAPRKRSTAVRTGLGLSAAMLGIGIAFLVTGILAPVGLAALAGALLGFIVAGAVIAAASLIAGIALLSRKVPTVQEDSDWTTADNIPIQEDLLISNKKNISKLYSSYLKNIQEVKCAFQTFCKELEPGNHEPKALDEVLEEREWGKRCGFFQRTYQPEGLLPSLNLGDEPRRSGLGSAAA